MMGPERDDVVISYYRVRQALGVLGLILPFLLILGGVLTLGGVEPSISDYYHTMLRDILVGVLCAIGIFLIAYPGHLRDSGEVLSDDRITTAAGLAAIGVAFFPNEGRVQAATVESPMQLLLGHQYTAIGHYSFAVIFFLFLATMCLRKFARTSNPQRRRVYRVCGWTILVMTACVIVASWFKIRGPEGPQSFVNDWLLVLWFEAVAIWAFAIAWLTKGRADMALADLLAAARGPDGP